MKPKITLTITLSALSAALVSVLAFACGAGYEPEGILTMGDHSVISPLRTTFKADFMKAFGHRLAAKSDEGLPGLDRANVLSAVTDIIAKDQARRGRDFDPEGIRVPHPLEYSLYLASLQTDGLDAVPLCEQILALPADQRRNLTALAHYRLARLLMKETKWEDMTVERGRLRMASIRRHLEATKQAVRDGCPDVCRISLQCDGWIAYSESMIAPAKTLEEMGVADFGKALRTYLAMPGRGEANGPSSVLLLIRKMVDDQAYEACAKDPDLRRLMTIYLCAGGSDEPFAFMPSHAVSTGARQWVEALKNSGLQPGDDALRIANLQYTCGDWEGCAETLAHLPSDDPMAALLRSRINLRNGNLPGAIASLKPAVHQERPGPYKEYMASETNRENVPYSGIYLQAPSQDLDLWACRVRGEMGVLLLTDKQYGPAMDAFYYSSNSRDAAYVGECLLSIGELKDLVDRKWAKPLMTKELSPDDQPRMVPVRYEVRDLLARRLFRAGRWEEALPYFGDDVRPWAIKYIELRKKADRWSFDRLGRADAYWRAALIMAKHGDELIHNDFGRYWSPDGSWYLQKREELVAPNWHERPDLPKLRLIVNDWKIPTNFVRPSTDETQRAKAWIKMNLEHPDYSHRMAIYAAVDLIMRSVSFLPDNDPRGALMLQFAGNQLKFIEPKAVQPAYRTLAIRFKQTPLGKHAWNRHWFSHDDGSDDPDLLTK